LVVSTFCRRRSPRRSLSSNVSSINDVLGSGGIVASGFSRKSWPPASAGSRGLGLQPEVVAAGFSRKSGLPAKAGSYGAPEGLFDSGKNEHKGWDEVPVASDELRDEEYGGAGRRRGGL